MIDIHVLSKNFNRFAIINKVFGLQAALGTGLDITRIKMALRQKLEQTGLPFSSADALIEAALDVQHEEFAAQDIR